MNGTTRGLACGDRGGARRQHVTDLLRRLLVVLDLAQRGLGERHQPPVVAVAADDLGVLRRALGESVAIGELQ
jgi:hypothetical protein